MFVNLTEYTPRCNARALLFALLCAAMLCAQVAEAAHQSVGECSETLCLLCYSAGDDQSVAASETNSTPSPLQKPQHVGCDGPGAPSHDTLPPVRAPPTDSL